MDAKPYRIEPARLGGGAPRPGQFKIIFDSDAGAQLIMGPFMFEREEAEAVCEALNDAFSKGVNFFGAELAKLPD